MFSEWKETFCMFLNCENFNNLCHKVIGDCSTGAQKTDFAGWVDYCDFLVWNEKWKAK